MVDAPSGPSILEITPRDPSVGGPVIGVTPSLDHGRRLRAGADYWYLNRSYTRALLNAGAAPVLLCPDTPIETCLQLCEGLVLSGGGDLPESFGGAGLDDPSWAERVPTQAESLERIRWERALLEAFASRGRPVLGVCFGMQLMNLHFGGSLLTDVTRRSRPGLDHGSVVLSAAHAVRISSTSAFFGSWQAPPTVSSSHRQAVDQVAAGFEASAWADDGIVEAIERGPLVGIEWHPESDASGAFVYARLVARVLAQR